MSTISFAFKMDTLDKLQVDGKYVPNWEHLEARRKPSAPFSFLLIVITLSRKNFQCDSFVLYCSR